MAGFRGLGERARALADRHRRAAAAGAGGRLRAHVLGAAACTRPLAGVLGTGELLDDPVAFLPDQPEHADEAIEAMRAAHAPYWTVLR